MDWDVVINGIPHYVVRIEGYVHTIGGRYGENDLWAYPRDKAPTYDTLVEFGCAYFPTYRFLIEVDRIEFKWVFIEPSNHNPSLVYTIVHTASDVAEYLAITSDSHTATAPGLCLVPFRFGVVFGFISNTPSDRAIFIDKLVLSWSLTE